jgi:hypothetical protein
MSSNELSYGTFADADPTIKKRVWDAVHHNLSATDDEIPSIPRGVPSAEVLDGEVINLTYDESGPNAVEVDTTEQLYETMLAFFEILRGPDGVNRGDMGYIITNLIHEMDHGKAKLALGALAQDLVYGLWIQPEVQPTGERATGRLDATPYTTVRQMRTTKLGLAAIIAAPKEPSAGDLLALEEMGYAGAEDVARRVILHNERSSQQIPIPKVAQQPGFKI